MSDKISPMKNSEFEFCQKILEDIIFSNQHKEGYWPYNLAKNRRFDFDYHQGFIIESLIDISNCQRYKNDRIHEVIKSGLDFYMNKQFNSSGFSKWKLNSSGPIDIHDLCQGIITFSKAANYGKLYFNFAQKTCSWTIKNMRDRSGYFYYHKWPKFTNKIPYFRWSQAWTALALSTMLECTFSNKKRFIYGSSNII